MDRNAVSDLESIFGFKFSNQALLLTALTHSSYAKQRQFRHLDDNERLEFLGDAVLKLLVSDYLYRKYPKYSEGDLTKVRAKLVSDRNFSILARTLHLGKYILFSQGEKSSGGAEKNSNLANVFEAVLGACYLDQGWGPTQAFFDRLVDQKFVEMISDENLEDYKTQLQEFLQREKSELPQYEVYDTTGPDHQREFHVRVTLFCRNQDYAFEGKGFSKKSAEQLAAKLALLELNPSSSMG